jgi:hypothetical protein
MERDSATRQRYERTQQLDSVIQEAIRRVPVPEGLASRLLAAVDAGEEPAGDAAETAVATGAHVGRAPGVTTNARWPMNLVGWKMMAAVSTAAAAAVVLSVSLASRDTGPITSNDIDSRVRQWSGNVDGQSWRPDDFPDDAYPVTRHVRLRPRRWQHVPSGMGAIRVVCYDLTPTGSERVWLFVLPTERPVDLPSQPGKQPVRNTQSCCVGWWQEPDLVRDVVYVYALSVSGGADRYRAVMRWTPSLAASGAGGRPSA